MTKARAFALTLASLAALSATACGGSSASSDSSPPGPSPTDHAPATGPMTASEACWHFNQAWLRMPDRLTLEVKLIKSGTANKASLSRMSDLIDDSLSQIQALKPYLPAATADLVPRIVKDWETAVADFVRIGDTPDWLTNPQVVQDAAEQLAAGEDIDAVGALLRTSGCATP
jgi:hypothetical protein